MIPKVGGTLLPPERGTVVYVHPEGRFYTVEFTFTGRGGRVRKFRESYIADPEAGSAPRTRGPSLPVGYGDD